MTYKPRYYTTVGSVKQKRRSSEEVAAQNKKNNELAAEYKTASPNRRREIFEEYYEGNEHWIGMWRKWEYSHWAELTQIFVTYWHKAFMRYTPFTENSIFNFYMDRLYKARASRDYRFYLDRSKNCTDMEFHFADGDAKPLRELFVHPQSEYDIADLRRRLVRNLDSQERSVVEGYFFGDSTLDEVRDAVIEIKEGTKRYNNPVASAKYHFNQKYDKLLDKLYLEVNKEDLLEMTSNPRMEHPLYNFNQKDRSVKANRKHAKKIREAVVA